MMITLPIVYIMMEHYCLSYLHYENGNFIHNYKVFPFFLYTIPREDYHPRHLTIAKGSLGAQWPAHIHSPRVCFSCMRRGAPVGLA